MYDYKVAYVVKVIDGDTYDLELDLGFYTTIRVRMRLHGLDTWELYGANAHELGNAAREAARLWLESRFLLDRLHVRTFKLNLNTPVGDGSFGRWAGEPYDYETGERLTEYLKEKGFEKTQ